MHSTMDHTLRFLLLIRLVVIGGQIVALATMDFLFGVAVPWLAVSLVLALLAVFTARAVGNVSAAPGWRPINVTISFSRSPTSPRCRPSST